MEIVSLTGSAAIAVPLQSHPGFGAALRGIGRDATALAVMDGVRELAQLVLIRRRLAGLSIGLATRGPVWAGATTTDERVTALRHLRKRGLSLVEADCPDLALPLAGFRQVATPAHVAELDLTGGSETRIKALDPAWRNKLRKAERAALEITVSSFSGDPQHWLLRNEAEQRRARRYHTLPAAITTAYARANPGQAMLFQADLAGEPVAGMLILIHGRVATYQIGWTGRRGRDTAAHQLLLMTAADWLAERGHERLDLGTVDTDVNPGLAWFKIGSGALVRQLGGSWLALPLFQAGFHIRLPCTASTGNGASLPLRDRNEKDRKAAHDTDDP